jgi:uncharacterized protein with ParB-like and HNH nuclease domain
MSTVEDIVETLNPNFSAEDNDTLDRMPKVDLPTSSSNTSMGYFLTRTGGGRFPEIQYFIGQWIFRFKIPSFQRDFVWTEQQCIRFIESAWLGYELGSYLVNKVSAYVRLKRDVGTPNEGKEYVHQYDDLLLDGLQRMTAIHKYVHYEFPVFGLFWRDLTRR